MTDELQAMQKKEVGTVLYIEDNPANLKLIQVFLSSRTGYSLLSANDPLTGLELAKTKKPDLILLDINLPEMNGYDVMARLLADDVTCHIPVVALSASAMPRDMERADKVGFKAYLTKPVDLTVLKTTIETHIRSA